MDYGIQLYSVRDEWHKDYYGTLKQMAALGYKQVELFGGDFGPGAKQLKVWLDELGLTVPSTHTGLNCLTDDKLAETLESHKAVGCSCIYIPGHDLSTKAKLDEFIDRVNYLQPLLAKEGFRLGFHNHSREFMPNEDGQIPYDEIRNRTNLELELDTYWSYNAGVENLSFMDEIAPRLTAVHMKDGLMGGEGKPLGMGTAPVKAVYEKAVAMGLPIIVESETQQPDGPTEAKICIEYLRSIE